MYILNFLIIPIILVSLFFDSIKLSYIVSLVSSLAAAFFCYANCSLSNILLAIAIFNLTPLVCWRFNKFWQRHRRSLRMRAGSMRDSYEQMLKERSLLRQSNSRISTDVNRIVELYQLTRDISSLFEFGEICDVFREKLREHFQFKSCRLILIDEDAGITSIKQVFTFRYDESQPREVEPEEADRRVLEESLRAQKMTYLEARHAVLMPLLADSKFFGSLIVEGLPVGTLGDFAILANQFSLGFRRVKLYQKMQKLAITDGLTELFGRRYFLQRLEEELMRSSRHNMQMAFLMIDIDHFKHCNDSFGHLTGDAVLRGIAYKIKSCVREIDLVGRFGGEEFSVLLPETDKSGGRNVAERIRSSIDKGRFQAYDESIKSEVSIGVAVFPMDAADSRQLIDKADKALYQAKENGRNKVCLS